MSFNIYADYDQQFLYIEKNNHWYMTLYDVPESCEIHIVPVPAIKNTSELVKEDIKFWDCFEDHEITRCPQCDQEGYYFDSAYSEYKICDCYHGQRIGFKALEAHLNDNQEFYSHDDYLEWRR